MSSVCTCLGRIQRKEGVFLNARQKKTSGSLISKLEEEIELLQRHVDMLKAIGENEPIGILRLADMLSCPQHKVRYSLRLLEQEGLIEPSSGGAVSTKKVDAFISELKERLEFMSVCIEKIRKSLD